MECVMWLAAIDIKRRFQDTIDGVGGGGPVTVFLAVMSPGWQYKADITSVYSWSVSGRRRWHACMEKEEAARGHYFTSQSNTTYIFNVVVPLERHSWTINIQERLGYFRMGVSGRMH